jgi:ABC-type multidrug transport system permease subunit
VGENLQDHLEVYIQYRSRQPVSMQPHARDLWRRPFIGVQWLFLPLALAPDWIATLARLNPVNWAIEAGREALLATPDWSFILPRMGGLLVVALLSLALATRAFRTYQRSA